MVHYIANHPIANRVSGLPHEISMILYLTPTGIKSLKEYSKTGTAEKVLIPSIREVIKGCRDNKTNRVILIHNHPPIGGESDSSPSVEDLQATKKFKAHLAFYKIELVDHIILGERDYFSFKENGIL